MTCTWLIPDCYIRSFWKEPVIFGVPDASFFWHFFVSQATQSLALLCGDRYYYTGNETKFDYYTFIFDFYRFPILSLQLTLSWPKSLSYRNQSIDLQSKKKKKKVHLSIKKMRPATLLKKRLWHRCIPVNFITEHLRTTASSVSLKYSQDFSILDRHLAFCENSSRLVRWSFLAKLVNCF